MPVMLSRKQQSFEGVAAGQTATCRLTRGMAHHQTHIEYSGVTLAQMEDLRLVANGRVLQKLPSGTVLNAMNQFDGREAASGVLTLDMERYGLMTRAGRMFTAINTGDTGNGVVPISNLLVEVDIAVGAVGPVLSATAVQSPNQGSNDNGHLKHVRVFGYDPAGSGEYEIADLPKFGRINRIFFKETTAGVILDAKIERDGYVVFERTRALNEAIQKDGVRVPQTGYYVVDFTENSYGGDGLEMVGVQDFRIRLNMNAANHIDAIVEYIAPLNG